MPTIQFLTDAQYITTSQSISVSKPMKFGVSANGPDAMLTRLLIQRTFQGTAVTAFDSTFSKSSYTKAIKVLSQSTAGTEDWSFTVYDENGNTAGLKLTITTTP